MEDLKLDREGKGITFWLMSSEEQQVNWQPLEQLPFIAGIVDENLKELESTSALFAEGKDRPGALDDKLVKRAQRLYGEQLNMLPVFEEQVQRWQKSGEADATQMKELDRLTGQLKRQRSKLEETLKLLDQLKSLTIETIVAKDDAQLALEILTGELKMPKMRERRDN